LIALLAPGPGVSEDGQKSLREKAGWQVQGVSRQHRARLVQMDEPATVCAATHYWGPDWAGLAAHSIIGARVTKASWDSWSPDSPAEPQGSSNQDNRRQEVRTQMLTASCQRFLG
jgi:hypothetical protein